MPLKQPVAQVFCRRSGLHSRETWRMTRKNLNSQHFARRKIFIRRILVDFAHQWRHVLCGRFNESTCRRLASAIIRIATLDFDVEDITDSRQGLGGSLVSIHNLPEWEPYNGNVVQVGDVSVIICPHIQHASTLVRDNFRERKIRELKSVSSEAPDRTYTYLVISVREILLYRINSEYQRCTQPVLLLPGDRPPFEDAIKLLLEATQISTSSNSLQRLPFELQNMILDKVSAGPIERARISCILDIGFKFAWTCDNRPIKREEGRTNRHLTSAAESHIKFNNCSSGVAYK